MGVKCWPRRRLKIEVIGEMLHALAYHCGYGATGRQQESHMQRWIIIGIGVATVGLASVYSHWLVAGGSAVATLFALFRKPKIDPTARKPGRVFTGRNAGGGDGGGD